MSTDDVRPTDAEGLGGGGPGRFARRSAAAFRQGLAALVWVLGLTLSVPSAVAQPQWDPDRYRSLVEESNALYEQAQAEGITGLQRVELLGRSVTLKQEAIEQLRAGLESGELEAFGDRPREELLILHQNVIVLLVEIEACTAARERLAQASRDFAILPEVGEATLASVRERLDLACPLDRRALAEVASRAAGEVAAAGRAGREAADRATHEREAMAAREAQESAVSSVGRAHERAEVALAARSIEVGGGDEPSSSDRPEAGPALLPFILMGTGVALVGAGVAVDLAGADDRDALDALYAECVQRVCDYGQRAVLEDDIQTNRVIVASVLGAGIVTSAVGVVLWLVGGEEGETPVAVAPFAGPGGVGSVLQVRY